jgi:hypothetical protein
LEGLVGQLEIMRKSETQQLMQSCKKESAPSEFKFVTVTHPDTAHDAQTLREIRKHVMRHIGMARRKTHRKLLLIR